MNRIIFRQLFEKESSTYTYLLGCLTTKKAILIDPVLETVDRDVRILRQLGLELIYGLNTHVHADHITGTHNLRASFPLMQTGLGAANEAKSDVKFAHGEVIKCGDVELEVRHTPGHTEGCISYVLHQEKLVFTGDALFIRGCGRTDFQGGSAATLFDSVHGQLYTLNNDFKVYPAHNYAGETMSTIAEEKEHNPRLTKTKDDFVALMAGLNLSYPKKIDLALPWNLNCGAEPIPK